MTASPVVLTRRRSAIRPRRLWAAIADFAFALPVVILLGLLILYPVAISTYRSFFDWQPGYSSPWVGLNNYSALLHSGVFHQVVRNEAFLLLGVPIWVLLPLVIATLLFDGVPFAGVFRSIFFFPAILSPAIIGIMFRAILAPDGMLNKMLGGVGLGALERSWIDSPNLVKPVLVGVLAWAGMGTGVVIFSAGLSALPPEQVEAAQIEGASFWQLVRFVMFPAIRPLVAFYAILQVLSVFLFFFSWIFVLTQGGPGYSSTTFDWDIYTNALTFSRFGLAAAESVYLLGIVGVVLGFGRFLQKRFA